MTVTSYKPPLDLNEFISRCAPNQQAMIYGPSNCNGGKIKSWLEMEKEKKCFKDVFDFFVGSCQGRAHITCENRKITKIQYQDEDDEDGESFMFEICKNALVNMVIENFKREELGLPIIPIIFVVDKDDSKLDVKKILNRLPKTDKRGGPTNITDAEIRRAFRLCFDPNLAEGIRRVAQKTFLFISLVTNKEDEPVEYTFSIRLAPWDSAVWQNGWKNRAQQPKLPRQKEFPWREQVKALIAGNDESKTNNNKS